jgi:hypothetical protein
LEDQVHVLARQSKLSLGERRKITALKDHVAVVRSKKADPQPRQSRFP